MIKQNGKQFLPRIGSETEKKHFNEALQFEELGDLIGSIEDARRCSRCLKA